MRNLEHFAYQSKLINKSPEIKMIFAGTTLVLCMLADSLFYAILVFWIMAFMIVKRGGTPLPFFLRMLMIPAFFLVIGLITIALDVANDRDIFYASVPIGNYFLGISKSGTQIAFSLFFKSMGAVSCLYFLSMTTSMTSLLGALRRWHTPGLLVELAELTYRFLSLLQETATNIYTAQKTRLGYNGTKSSFVSLGLLMASLFVRTFKRSEDIYMGLESRGYRGEMCFLEEENEMKKWDILWLIIFEGAMLCLCLAINYGEGISQWML